MDEELRDRSNINPEQQLAAKIDACLVFLHDEQGIGLNEVAVGIGVGSPNNLSFARDRKGKYLRSRKNFNGRSRRQVLEDLIQFYGLSLTKNEAGGWLVAFSGQLPVNDAAALPEALDKRERTFHFIYYFIGSQVLFQRPDKVEKGLFKVHCSANNKEEAELVLYGEGQKGNSVERRYTGEISKHPASGKIVNLSSGKSQGVHSTLVLRTGELGFDQKWIWGAYVASGPAAGIAVLQEISEEQAKGPFPADPVTDSYVSALLYAKRYDLGVLPGLFADPNEIQEKVRSMEGLYYGFVLNHREEAMRKFRMQIHSDGTFQFESASNDVRKGQIVYDGKLPFMTFHINHRPSLQTSETTFIIPSDLGDRNRLYGVYFGWTSRNGAMAGKLYLQRAAEQDYGAMTSRYIYDAEELRQVPGLLDFYLRKEDKLPMVDSPDVLARILGISFDLPALVQEPERRFLTLKGTYRLYHLRETRDSIVSFILQLHPNGDFEFKGYLDDYTLFKGKAHLVFRTILSLQIQEKNGYPYHGSYQFFIGEHGNRKFDHLHGTGQFVTNHHEIVCVRAILFPVSENFEQSASRTHQLPLNQKTSRAFEDLNRRRCNIGYFLMGDTHNLLKPPRDPGRDLSRLERYAEIYFSSACYYAWQSSLDPDNRTEGIRKCLEFLRRAFDHGFRLLDEDKAWIDRELSQNNGLLSRLPAPVLASIDWEKGMILKD